MQLKMASNSKIEDYTIKNGFCIVINIKYFDGHQQWTRDQSENNVENIKKIFQFLNCKVNCYEEFDYQFTDKKVRNVIIKSIKSEEFNKCDGFVLYIHTYGFEKSFFTSNCQLILRDEIIDIFKTENILYFNYGSQ